MWWIYCGLLFIPFTLGSVYPGKCSDIIPTDEADIAIEDITQLNGSIWKPLRYHQLFTPPLNFFDASPYFHLDCVEFQFDVTDEGTFVNIVPTNCTGDDEWCWMEHFLLERADNTSNLLYTASIMESPSECVRAFTYFYLMTPDVDQILVLWSCFDFNNGSMAEGIVFLGKKNVEVDFMTMRKARKMINSAVPLELWSQPKNNMQFCSCQTRFARYPCYGDEDCRKVFTYPDIFAASFESASTSGFLLWFLIGAVTFATASVLFIYFSGISECLCSETYSAF